MNGEDWTGVIFGMGVLILGTIILVVVLTQVGRFLALRNERQAESRYAELAQRYEELAARVTTQQESTADTLDDIRGRVVEVERLLRTVD